MSNKHVYVEDRKYNVNKELAFFNGCVADEVTCHRLKTARDRFLEELDAFLPMFHIRTVKTATQWTAFMKVCEKLLSFDNMLNTCFVANGQQDLIYLQDKKAEDLIQELEEM